MFLRINTILALAVSIFVFLSAPVFAEGDVICSGKALLTTDLEDINAGQTHFDAHDSPLTDANKVADLSIVLGPGIQGLAPKHREHAACVSVKAGDEALPLADKEFRIEGWSWNDNVGFISYYCGTEDTNPAEDHDNNPVDTDGDDVVDTDVGPISCGALEDYGVVISDDTDGNGIRELSGYAWNEAFGWINFSCSGGVDGLGNACGGIDYGVTLDTATGDLSGYTWTESGVYMGLSGGRIQLTDILLPPPDDYCSTRAVCSQITPDPDDFAGQGGDPNDTSLTTDEIVRIADGVDEYTVHIYLREGDGDNNITLPVTALDPIPSVIFNWTDTLKTNQLSGQTGDFSTTTASNAGGVIYKPVFFNTVTTPSSENFASIFTEVDPVGDPGHYTVTIKSVAPTSNENISLTTSTEPPFPVRNETFFADLGAWVFNIQSNNLILKNIVVGSDPPIFPNGKDGLSLRYKSAIEIDPFYADNFKDSIDGIRLIPNSYKIGAKRYGNLTATNENAVFELVYSESETGNSEDPDCIAAKSNFLLQFLRDLNGNTHEYGEDFTVDTVDISQLLSPNGPIEASSVVSLVVGESGCKQVEGPSIFSEINYDTAGKNISIYGNKLARIASLFANPVAIVTGNIYAQEVFSPALAEEDRPIIQETGQVETSEFRNIVYESVNTILKDVKLIPSQASAAVTCTITSLNTIDDFAVSGVGCTSSFYGTDEATHSDGTVENILWFNNADVVFDLDKDLSGDSDLNNTWGIVVSGGNAFVDDDIYKTIPTNLAVVVIGPRSIGCSKKGNIYIGSDVNNVQANMHADCSLLGYLTGDRTNLDSDGLYNVEGKSLPDLFNFQFSYEGSLSILNTIGGSEPDEDGKIIDGLGNVYVDATTEERQKSQMYDLNYFRLFRLDIQTHPESGLPFDFDCEKYLSIDEILQINLWQENFPDETNFPPVIGENTEKCDGIETNAIVDEGGDLVLPIGEEGVKAEGLEDTEIDPVYIFFRQAKSIFFIEG